MKKQLAHYHFSLVRVLAIAGRNVARDKSAYMQRTRERDMRERSPVTDASSYMTRQEQKEEQREAEVAYTALVLPDGVSMTCEELWTGMDLKARGKNGEYRQHGGHQPGLALWGNASIPYGVGEAGAILATESFAYWLVDEFDCAVEVALHRKGDAVDHAHFLIADRVIGPDGIGKKIRAFNGLADLKAGTGLEVEDGRQVAPALEAMRARWAKEMRAASGNPDIDHRSFARRGLSIQPVPNVDRKRIEKETRQGHALWRDERNAIVLPRNAAFLASGIATDATPIAPRGRSPDVQPVSTPSSAAISIGEPIRVAAAAIVAATPLPDLSHSKFDHLPSADTGRLKLLLNKYNASQDPASRASLLEDIKREVADIETRARLAWRAREEKAALDRFSQLARIDAQKFTIGAEQPGPYFESYIPRIKAEVAPKEEPTTKSMSAEGPQPYRAEPVNPSAPPRPGRPEQGPPGRQPHPHVPSPVATNPPRSSARESFEDEAVDLRDALSGGNFSSPASLRPNQPPRPPGMSSRPEHVSPPASAVTGPNRQSVSQSSPPRRPGEMTPAASSPAPSTAPAVPYRAGGQNPTNVGGTPAKPAGEPAVGPANGAAGAVPRPGQSTASNQTPGTKRSGGLAGDAPTRTPVNPPQTQQPVAPSSSVKQSPRPPLVPLLDVAVKLGTAYYHRRMIPKKSQAALAELVHLSYDQFELKMRAMREELFLKQKLSPEDVVQTAMREAANNRYPEIIEIRRQIVEMLEQNPPKAPVLSQLKTPDRDGSSR